MPQESSRDILHISDDGDNFDYGEKELGFTVALHAKQIYSNDDSEENSDEYGMVMSFPVPKVNGNGCSNNFQRKDSEPLHGIILPQSERFREQHEELNLPIPWQIPTQDQGSESSMPRTIQPLETKQPFHPERAPYNITYNR